MRLLIFLPFVRNTTLIIGPAILAPTSIDDIPFSVKIDFVPCMINGAAFSLNITKDNLSLNTSGSHDSSISRSIIVTNTRFVDKILVVIRSIPASSGIHAVIVIKIIMLQLQVTALVIGL